MATSSAEEQLDSIPRWGATLIAKTISEIIIWGLAFTIFSAIAILTLPRLYPATEPFIWLVIWGNVLGMLGFVEKGMGDSDVQSLLANLDEMEAREFLWFLLVALGMVIAGASFQVAVIASITAVLSVYFGFGAVAVMVAVLFPIVDSIASRTRLNWNITSTGALIGLGLFLVLSFLQGTSRELTLQAGRDVRAVMT